jgi:hypothetical protein
MNKQFYVLVAVFAFMFLNPVSAWGQTDLSMRVGLYFTGAKTDKIDRKNDKSVAKDGTMELRESQASNCDGKTCEFNIGFIAVRTGNSSGAFVTDVILRLEEAGMVGKKISFADKETSKEGILPLKLKVGTNKVTLTIDPYKKTAESNEDNNTFSVNLRVMPSIKVGTAPAKSPDTVLLNLDCTRTGVGAYSCSTAAGFEACVMYWKDGKVKHCLGVTAVIEKQAAMDQELFKLGCKRFLGRPDEYLCKTQKSFDACETYHKDGRVKKCRNVKQ